MSRLLLVRHGKASDHWHDYDHLSPRGFEQAALVGQRLVRDEPELRAVYHGTMRRQRETAETVRAQFVNAGKAVPELTEVPTLTRSRPASSIRRSSRSPISRSVSASPAG